MFIRTKKIRKNGNEYVYAYKVQNRWRKGQKASRQKVKGYLGKVIRPEKIQETDFFVQASISDVQAYVKGTTKRHIIRDLVVWELRQHGFKEKEGLWHKEDIFFDAEKMVLYQLKGGKKQLKIVLAMNEGFLCNSTLKALLLFRLGISEEETGYKMASLLTEAGIKVPEELFVAWMTSLLGR